MIVQFFPKVASVKIVTPWIPGKRGQVECVARLTRSLTPSEAERLEETLGVEVQGDRVRYSCRPEELEQEEERIMEALLRVARPLEPRARGRRPKARRPQ